MASGFVEEACHSFVGFPQGKEVIGWIGGLELGVGQSCALKERNYFYREAFLSYGD